MDPGGYDRLVPNIANVEVDGALVRVRWKCPVTGRELGQSTANMLADPSMANRVQANVKRGIAYEVIYGAARMVAGMIGGAVGRVVSGAVYTAAGDINARVTAGSDYTEASRRAAIVTAFESVKASFVWDEPGQRFVAR